MRTSFRSVVSRRLQMRMRLAFCLIATAVVVSMSAVNASHQSSTIDSATIPKSRRVYVGGSIDARSYRSPGKLHKVVVPADDTKALAEVTAAGAVEVSDYGSFKLFLLGAGELEVSEARRSDEETGRNGDTANGRLNVRDDLNVLLLRSGAIDTTADNPTELRGEASEK